MGIVSRIEAQRKAQRPVPEWVRRAQEHKLVGKDYTAVARA